MSDLLFTGTLRDHLDVASATETCAQCGRSMAAEHFADRSQHATTCAYRKAGEPTITPLNRPKRRKGEHTVIVTRPIK